MNDSETLKNIERLVLAILMLLSENREISLGKIDMKDRKNIEVLLSKAGFKSPEIAKIIDKNLAAVQKTIQRSRKEK